jgi:hypothetical protein
MKKSTTKKVQAYIARANAMGSTASTLAGAGRYILQHTKSVLANQIALAKEAMAPRPLTWKQAMCPMEPRKVANRYHGMTRESIADQIRTRRLIARYAGMVKLPRYLSDRDKARITSSAEHRDVLAMRAVPIYAQSFYATTAIRELPRLAAELKRVDAARGALVDSAAVASDAHQRYNWGRLSVHRPGHSVDPANVGVRETGSNSNWHKRSTLDRRANYSLIYPRATKRGNLWTGHYVDCDKGVHRVFRSRHFICIDTDIAIRLPNKPPVERRLPVHVQRRILAMATPRVLTIEYDRTAKKLMLVDATGENYHANGEIRSAANAQSLVATAFAAFRKRRSEKAVALGSAQAARVFVSIEDSLAAGNCTSMTNDFASRIWAELGAQGPCAVRADLVLARRHDSYSLRACAYAAQRVVA